jgi:hypothetical protein
MNPPAHEKPRSNQRENYSYGKENTAAHATLPQIPHKCEMHSLRQIITGFPAEVSEA